MISLKPCPFCGSVNLKESCESLDERSGYNIICKIQCTNCSCVKFERSKEDKNGWCMEDRDSVKDRLHKSWNARV